MMNKSNPIISVILPVYNMALYLNAAIESILNQTFNAFELIIIDDASTDNSAKIIQSYSDDRIVYLKNKDNIGNYPSRNNGISIARGKYIAVMDGDDVAHPDRLNRQYRYIKQHPGVLAVGTEFRFMPESSKESLPISHEAIILSFLKGYYAMLHPSLLILTCAVRDIGGYNEKYRYASDYDLLCRLSFSGKLVNLPVVLMNYRKHILQITQHNHMEQLRYAEEIRRNYQLNFINAYKSEDQSLAALLHVSHFQMGAAIAYYTYARKTKSKTYETFADYLLDQAIGSVAMGLPSCLDNGIYGIGCGLIYLLRNHFVEGDEDEILEEIDHSVATNLCKKKEENVYYQDMQCYMAYRGGKNTIS